MVEHFARVIFWNLFKFLGACIRWIIGTIYNSIVNTPKIPFNEYLNGPLQSKLDLTKEDDLKKLAKDDGYDINKNVVVGGLFFLGLAYLIAKQFIE